MVICLPLRIRAASAGHENETKETVMVQEFPYLGGSSSSIVG